MESKKHRQRGIAANAIQFVLSYTVKNLLDESGKPKVRDFVLSLCEWTDPNTSEITYGDWDLADDNGIKRFAPTVPFSEMDTWTLYAIGTNGKRVELANGEMVDMTNAPKRGRKASPNAAKKLVQSYGNGGYQFVPNTLNKWKKAWTENTMAYAPDNANGEIKVLVVVKKYDNEGDQYWEMIPTVAFGKTRKSGSGGAGKPPKPVEDF